jgi:hypothetical protein
MSPVECLLAILTVSAGGHVTFLFRATITRSNSRPPTVLISTCKSKVLTTVGAASETEPPLF